MSFRKIHFCAIPVIAMALVHGPTSFAVGGEAGDRSERGLASESAGFGDELRRLSDLAVLLRSRNISPAEKSLAIDEAIDQFSVFATSLNQKDVVALIAHVNEVQHSETVQEILADLPVLKQVPNEMSSQFLEKVASVLARSDGEVLKYRIKTAIELLRYVIHLREQEIIHVAESESPDKKLKEVIAADIERHGERLKHFDDILSVMLERQSRYQSALAANGGKASADNPMFTKEEIKRIGQSVAGLNVITLTKGIQSLSELTSEAAIGRFILGDKLKSLNFGESLAFFQDGLSQMSPEEVVRIITEDFGRPPSEIFIDFDPAKPIKAASVAQTYRAKVRTRWGGTRNVIVKVQRPGLEQSLADSKVFRELAILAGKVYNGKPGNSTPFEIANLMLEGFEQEVEGELRVSQEIANLERMRMLFAFYPGIQIPKPLKNLSSRRVLTMTEVPGTNIGELLHTQDSLSLYSRMKLFTRLEGALAFQLVLGEMHADLQNGNVLAQRNGRISLVDWAQTFDTKGVLADPVKLLFALQLGNAQGLARTLASMNLGKDFREANFIKNVEEIFSERKIVKRSPKAAILGGEGFVDADNVADAFTEVIESAARHGFVPQPKYLQLMRVAVPVGLNLDRLKKNFPPWARRAIKLNRILVQAPGLLSVAAAGRVLEVATRPLRWSETKIDESRLENSGDSKGAIPSCRELVGAR